MACSTTRSAHRVFVAITPPGFSLYLRVFIIVWAALWIHAAWVRPPRDWNSWFAVIGFAVGTILIAYSWIWNTRGREELDFSSTELTYRRLLFGFSRVRHFQMSKITDPRFVLSRRRTMGGATPSGLGFSYQNKIFRIGDHLTWEESKAIAAALEDAFPEHATTWRNYDEGLPDSNGPVVLNLR